jgi:hypothetical protein
VNSMLTLSKSSSLINTGLPATDCQPFEFAATQRVFSALSRAG